jgi:hypothetical protein
VDALSSGGLHQAREDAVGFESAFRSGSEADLAEDYQMAERLFRVIVCRRYAGASKESKGTGSRYVFASWSDGGAQTHTVFGCY